MKVRPEGNPISLISIHEELKTQEAAELLNVSRPYLVSLLEGGELPYRKVGTEYDVPAKDIISYKTKIDKARLKALEELSGQAQDLNMGY